MSLMNLSPDQTGAYTETTPRGTQGEHWRLSGQPTMNEKNEAWIMRLWLCRYIAQLNT